VRKAKNIAIITNNTLISIGLKVIIEEYFPPVVIHSFTTTDAFTNSTTQFDYFFIETDAFIRNTDYFLLRRPKISILCDEKQTASAACNLINMYAAQEIIIEQLQKLFSANNKNEQENKDLSAREIDVLQLIVQGNTNKDIADKLCISFNTVLTHRKNITAKLGIKTTSGLTFYAMMNGLC
jgi:DNA-binding NarL/FixJ family response regulator